MIPRQIRRAISYATADTVGYIIYHGRYGGLITIFVMLTGEEWPKIMWEGMTTAHDATVIYFVVVQGIGSYDCPQ